jgi:hypothetical protein
LRRRRQSKREKNNREKNKSLPVVGEEGVKRAANESYELRDKKWNEKSIGAANYNSS